MERHSPPAREWAAAVNDLMRAAYEAAERHDWATAAERFRHLLALLQTVAGKKDKALLVPALVGYARCLLAVGQAPAALPYARRALRLAPKASEAREVYLETLEALGKWREACRLAERWGRTAPNDVRLHLMAARLRHRLGDLSAALQHLLVALNAAPDHPEPYREAAHILESAGQPRRAIALLRKGLERIPDDPTLWITLGYLLRGQRRHREALRCLERALELGADSAEVRELLGQLCSELGWLHKAEEHLRKGLEHDPDHLGLLDLLAFVYIQQGRLQEALPLLVRAVQRAPLDPFLQFKLATVHHQLGHFADAVQAYRRVIALAPGTELADDAQEMLEVLDNHQLEQVILLCMEDPVFRARLMRDPKGTLEAKGFALSDASLEVVTNMDFSRLPKRWGSSQGRVG